MPGGDGTGPMGMGSMTGRAAGFCAGNNVAGFQNSAVRGGGFGRGRGGGGWGRRNRFYATGLTGWERAPMSAPAFTPPVTAMPTNAQRLDALKDQADRLSGVLEDVRNQIRDLEEEPNQ